jgi:hypothetical protein
VSVGDLLGRVRAALTAAKVPHMLTGSFASSVHGEPRATHDLDIVIAPTRQGLIDLLEQFPESEYYVSAEAAMAAFDRRGQFNLIDLKTGWKVDFILLKSRDFSRQELDRRRTFEVAGVEIEVASAEDALIAKLEWAKLGSSRRQIEDVAGILRMQGDHLDMEYVRQWVVALGLEDPWEAALAHAVGPL